MLWQVQVTYGTVVPDREHNLTLLVDRKELSAALMRAMSMLMDKHDMQVMSWPVQIDVRRVRGTGTQKARSPRSCSSKLYEETTEPCQTMFSEDEHPDSLT